MSEKSEKRRIYIYVNGKEVEDNLRSLTSESRRLRNELAGLSPNTKEFTDKAKDLQKVNGRIGEIRRETNGMNGVLGKAKNLFSGLGGALLGGGIIAGLGSLAKGIWDLTSNLEQIEKKSKIVFGTSLPAITKAAEENADKMGIANSEYVKLATNNADLLKPMGFTTQAATDLTVRTLDLAGALSEWTGGQRDASEVGAILTKAMLGEREQLKELGISIQEADVQQRLLSEGKNKLTGLALQQAKAEATLQLMLEKSTDAQNAYNDSSDSMLRKKKTFTAFWGDIKDAVGGLFDDLGNDVAYFSDNMSFLFNNIKQLSNETLGTTFDTEPIESFSNAILHTSPNLKQLTKEVEKYTIATDQGKDAMGQLAVELVKTYGEEKGRKIFNAFLEEQVKAAKVMQQQEKNQQEFAEEAALAAAKEKAQKEAEIVLKERAKLQEKIDKLKEEATLKALSDDEAELERIRQKYARIMEEDALNEEQKKELEALREEELALKEEEQEIKRQEERQKLLDEQYAFEEEMHLLLLEGIEKELAETDAKYEALYAKADKFGMDTTSLQMAHAKEKQLILDKQAKEEQKTAEETQKAVRASIDATIDAYGSMFESLSVIFADSEEMQKAFGFAQIAVDTAKSISALTAMSEANPANAVTFGGAGIAQYGAGLLRIFANIATAKKYLSFDEGGYTGDGFGLPDASGYKVAGFVHENEWVAPEWMTSSPQFADTIKMLEAARQAKTGFADGGYANSNTSATTPTPEFTTPDITDDNSDLLIAINNLNQTLSAGIRAIAVIDQNNLIDIQEGLNELNQN